MLNLSNKNKLLLSELLKIFYGAIQNDDFLEMLEYLNTNSLKSLEKTYDTNIKKKNN